MSVEPDISVFRADRPGIRKVLGDLEAEIMELIWARPAGQGTTVRDVFEVLYERRRLAYTTVMNTMTRLARKKLLRVEKVDQAYVYYPNFTQEEFIDALAAPQAAARARQLLDEIARRRAAEEGT